MKKIVKNHQLSISYLYDLFDKLSPIIVILSTAVILFATLFPFNFSQKLIPEITNISYAFRHKTDLTDSVNNVLLFIPFGFGLSNVINKYRKNIIELILIIFIASSGLSFTVEFLQILLPSRSTTIADIVNNSIGGLLGFLCFHIWKYKIINSIWLFLEKIRNSLSIKTTILAGITYTIFCLIIAANLPIITSLSNWDNRLFLHIGNEGTGDRPWRGNIYELVIADRSISPIEVENAFSQNKLLSDNDTALIAAYKFIGKDNFSDKTGNSPTLSWQGESGKTEETTGAFIDSRNWLKTSFSVSSITDKIRRSSQFTLSK
ncbi:VanZ family protein [Calothrix rhizosoleniae]|uniref:VanZ family protein n=1 Tax=Calothrix rhizosoleniae TaxID=888997 RepID=UPI000B4A1B71|nr:VanZ family protein [Calothrix rhizosoleniae]